MLDADGVIKVSWLSLNGESLQRLATKLFHSRILTQQELVYMHLGRKLGTPGDGMESYEDAREDAVAAMQLFNLLIRDCPAYMTEEELENYYMQQIKDGTFNSQSALNYTKMPAGSSLKWNNFFPKPRRMPWCPALKKEARAARRKRSREAGLKLKEELAKRKDAYSM